MISPFRAGDILFLHRGAKPSFMERAICWFQGLRGGYTSTRTHSAFFISPWHVFETTPGRTQVREVCADGVYPGSDIEVHRWRQMTPEACWAGVLAAYPHLGRDYPELRLLAQAAGLEAILHGEAMECCALVRTFLRGAGALPPDTNVWAGDTERLGQDISYDTDHYEWIWRGSLRAAGLVYGMREEAKAALGG